MGKALVLAEKPSVGKDIARVLGCGQGGQGYMEGSRYVVTWAMGHLITLADPEDYEKRYEKWELNDLPIIPDKLKLVVIGKTARQFGVVRGLITRGDISEIIIATDAGREGELVARWIIEKAGARKPIKRLWISSVTDKAITDGFKKLKEGREYDNLYRSAAARAEADWIVGINATRALTAKHNAQLSCGRVQTPTLSMVAAREDEIRKFVPKPFYGISASAKGVTFVWRDANGQTNTFDERKCDAVISAISGKPSAGKIITVNKSAKRENPPLPYDLTSLQAEANRRFGLPVKEVLSIMQALYENHKILTYPRTDSQYLSSDIVDTLHERISACSLPAYRKVCAKLRNTKFTAASHFVDDKKVSDHHAIIPTEQPAYLDKLNEKERKVYDLVVQRFLASLCPAFEYEQTEVAMRLQNELFTVRGKAVKSLGFKELTFVEKDEEQNLPAFTVGESVSISALKKTAGKTSPPPYFTEASLLTTMENPSAYMGTDDKSLLKTIGETGGIGTVATRADIIDKLFNSFVIEKRGKDIFITQKGRQLLRLAPAELRSPALTARWEQSLTGISKGAGKPDTFLAEIKQYTTKIIKEIKSSTEKFVHDNATTERCPDCGKFLLAVNGKKGKFLICQDRECGFRKSVSILTNARCPQCSKRLELVGDGARKTFVCICGHRENEEAFRKRMGENANNASKKDVENYLHNQKKSDPGNNAFALAFAKLKQQTEGKDGI